MIDVIWLFVIHPSNRFAPSLYASFVKYLGLSYLLIFVVMNWAQRFRDFLNVCGRNVARMRSAAKGRRAGHGDE